jgi:hypothetical protein
MVFRVRAGSRLGRAPADSVVAFEIDHLEEVGRRSWGVQAHGIGRLVSGLLRWGVGERGLPAGACAYRGP